jgi:hypothetical protein
MCKSPSSLLKRSNAYSNACFFILSLIHPPHHTFDPSFLRFFIHPPFVRSLVPSVLCSFLPFIRLCCPSICSFTSCIGGRRADLVLVGLLSSSVDRPGLSRSFFGRTNMQAPPLPCLWPLASSSMDQQCGLESTCKFVILSQKLVRTSSAANCLARQSASCVCSSLDSVFCVSVFYPSAGTCRTEVRSLCNPHAC